MNNPTEEPEKTQTPTDEPKQARNEFDFSEADEAALEAVWAEIDKNGYDGLVDGF